MLGGRNKWTQEELEQLRAIHEEESARGRKRLWVRVCQRVNSSVRPAKRQAIEYKWKNFCGVAPLPRGKLCKNEGLIELICTLAPLDGYQELARSPLFQGISESNIKNIFYSNARSLTNFLHCVLAPPQAPAATRRMLSDRAFLRRLAEIGVCLRDFRRSSLRMKHLIKTQRQEQCDSLLSESIEQLREEIGAIFEKMRVFYNTEHATTRKRGNFRKDQREGQRDVAEAEASEMGAEKERESTEIRTGQSEGEASDEKQESFAFITDDWEEEQCLGESGEGFSFFDWC